MFLPSRMGLLRGGGGAGYCSTEPHISRGYLLPHFSLLLPKSAVYHYLFPVANCCKFRPKTPQLLQVETKLLFVAHCWVPYYHSKAWALLLNGFHSFCLLSLVRLTDVIKKTEAPTWQNWEKLQVKVEFCHVRQ